MRSFSFDEILSKIDDINDHYLSLMKECLTWCVYGGDMPSIRKAFISYLILRRIHPGEDWAIYRKRGTNHYIVKSMITIVGEEGTHIPVRTMSDISPTPVPTISDIISMILADLKKINSVILDVGLDIERLSSTVNTCISTPIFTSDMRNSIYDLLTYTGMYGEPDIDTTSFNIIINKIALYKLMHMYQLILDEVPSLISKIPKIIHGRTMKYDIDIIAHDI